MIVLPICDQFLWKWVRERVAETVGGTGIVEVEVNATILGPMNIWLVAGERVDSSLTSHRPEVTRQRRRIVPNQPLTNVHIVLQLGA